MYVITQYCFFVGAISFLIAIVELMCFTEDEPMYKTIPYFYKTETLKVWSLLCIPILLLLAPVYIISHFALVWIGKIACKILLMDIGKRKA